MPHVHLVQEGERTETPIACFEAIDTALTYAAEVFLSWWVEDTALSIKERAPEEERRELAHAVGVVRKDKATRDDIAIQLRLHHRVPVPALLFRGKSLALYREYGEHDGCVPGDGCINCHGYVVNGSRWEALDLATTTASFVAKQGERVITRGLTGEYVMWWMDRRPIGLRFTAETKE